jgi:hypothetical protein
MTVIAIWPMDRYGRKRIAIQKCVTTHFEEKSVTLSEALAASSRGTQSHMPSTPENDRNCYLFDSLRRARTYNHPEMHND